jgi:hypothetical protein
VKVKMKTIKKNQLKQLVSKVPKKKDQMTLKRKMNQLKKPKK